MLDIQDLSVLMVYVNSNPWLYALILGGCNIDGQVTDQWQAAKMTVLLFTI